MKTSPSLRNFLLAAGSCLLAVSAANAQTWNGSVDGSWANDSNWSVAPVNGNSLTFSGTANQTNTNDAGITSVNIFTLENAGWNIGLGGSAFTITTLNATGSSNLTGTVRFADGDRVINLNGSNTTLDLAGTLQLARTSSQKLTVNGAGNTLEVDDLALSTDGTSRARTIEGAANIMVNGGLTTGGGADSLTKTNTGIMTVKGTSTYTGSTNISAGTFDLGGGGTGGSLASTSLTLGRAVFNYTRTGTNTQTFTTTNINGESAINVAAGNTLDLGTLTKGSVRSTVAFSGTGTIKGDIANDANGIIGGWATIGGDWAVSNGAGNAITAYDAGSYDTTSALGDVPGDYTGKMISVNNNQTLTGVITPSTLNFRTAAAHTLTLATGNNDVDGIMVTTTVGDNASVITGGTLRAGTAGGSLNIIQNNTNTLTINSAIANNGTASSFVKSGDGTLIMLSDINSTGGITISGGTLQLGNATTNGSIASQIVTNNGQLVLHRSSNLTMNAIQGTGSLTYNATGGGLTPNNSTSNNYSGGFTQNGGTMFALTNGTYNGFGTGTVTVNSNPGGWRISGTGSNTVLNNEMAWNAADMNLNTQTAGVDATATWNGNVTLGANVNVTQTVSQTSQISHVFNGNIGQTGGTRSLTFSGGDGITRSPVFTLNGTNTYTGNTTTTNPLSTLIIGGSGSLNSGNYAGTINAAGALTYSSSTNQVFSGSVSAASLVKDTSNTSKLTLSNASNTVTGNTTVSAGTLYVSGALTSAAVIVQANGTVGSNGFDGSIVGDLTIEAGGNLDLTGATSLGLSSTDILTLSGGDLTLGALTFEDIVGWDWENAAVGTYKLIDGTFTINWGSTAYLDAGTAYDFGNGFGGYFTSGSLNAVIVAIPEPGAALLGGLGFLLLLRRRR